MTSSEDARIRLEAIFDEAVFAIITINCDGVVEDVNAAALRMFGHSREDVVGQNVAMLMPEPYRGAHDGFIANYLATGHRKIIGIGREIVGLRRDGKTFPMHLSVSEVRLPDRTLFTGIIEDISARVEAEQRVEQLQNELIHVARLSAMGELASALAHELNQPLTAITNYANAAKRLLEREQTESATSLVLKAGDQALRAGEIIRRLRQFIEWGETEHTWEDLAPTVAEAAQLGLVGTRRNGPSFELIAPIELPRVMIDRVQIQQVVQNLVRNAVDVLEAWHGERSIQVKLEQHADEEVAIVVEDSGPGLAANVRERLFQPFVTTKRTGMGIGLSVSRNIVEAHGGNLRYEDRQEGGARFIVTLPVAKV